jgi:predicted nucleic acid-binding protein
VPEPEPFVWKSWDAGKPLVDLEDKEAVQRIFDEEDVTDAHIAALMRRHGVRVIYTRDRDFRRFDGIEPVDPFA